MSTTVTLTTAPTEPASGPVPYEYIEATAESYPQAYADAMDRAPEGRRAVVARADRA